MRYLYANYVICVGILHLEMIDGFVRKKNFATFSSLDQKYAYNMAKGKRLTCPLLLRCVVLLLLTAVGRSATLQFASLLCAVFLVLLFCCGLLCIWAMCIDRANMSNSFCCIGMGNVLMVNEAVRNSKLRYNEAYSIYKMMFKESGVMSDTLVQVGQIERFLQHLTLINVFYVGTGRNLFS